MATDHGNQNQLSKMATGNGHGENSHFDGWKPYDEDPYHSMTRTDEVIIQIRPAENTLCFDLIQERHRISPRVSICPPDGFKGTAISQDYRRLSEFREDIAKIPGKVRGDRVNFDPPPSVMSGGATEAQGMIAICLAIPGDALPVPTPYSPRSIASNPFAASSSGFAPTDRTFCSHSRSTDQETITPLTDSSPPPLPAPPREMPSKPPLQEPVPPCPDISETTTRNSKVLCPVFKLLHEEQLGRHILVLAIPMIIGLFSFYNMKDDPMKDNPLIVCLTALSLSFGVTLIWNGILLRRTFNRFSLVSELLGVAVMLSAFFIFVAWFLPLTLSFIPVVCWVLCLLPFAIAFYSEEASEIDKGNDHRLPV